MGELEDRLQLGLLHTSIDVTAPVRLEPLGRGRSNLTYRVTDGAGRRFVVRRPPAGPILPTVIDTELLIEAEKELGHSLRPFPEARVWLRDGFWARVYREFDLGVGVSSK